MLVVLGFNINVLIITLLVRILYYDKRYRSIFIVLDYIN